MLRAFMSGFFAKLVALLDTEVSTLMETKGTLVLDLNIGISIFTIVRVLFFLQTYRQQALHHPSAARNGGDADQLLLQAPLATDPALQLHRRLHQPPQRLQTNGSFKEDLSDNMFINPT